jgi:3'(2'), 5'-bisphosphate nucleotidase
VTPAERAALRPALVELARRAGDAIMAVYQSEFAVAHKHDRSPLTEADLASHRIIAAGLAALMPAVPLLSEESDPGEIAARRSWSRYWLVDPLDGTREFVKRNGEFTVNIALIEDGVATLGVVYAPALDWLAHAARDAGAMVERGGERRALGPLRRQPGPLRVAGSRSHGDARLNAFLERVGPHRLIALGSSLKFVLVAEGGADVYLRHGPTSEWDTAAGQCVLEACGGRVADLGLEPLRYNRRDTLLNPDFIAYADAEVDWAALLR